MVDIVLAAAFRCVGNLGAGLELGADKQHATTRGNGFGDRLKGRWSASMVGCLLQATVMAVSKSLI